MIFYFTGTGNTKWVAQQLADATGDALRFIPDELRQATLRYELDAEERLGFCFPTHGWQPPRIVREFIRRATFHWASSSGKKPFTYAVTTCGDNMGHAMRILQKELKAAKYKALSSSSQLTEKCRESRVLELLQEQHDSILKIPGQPPYIVWIEDE